MRIAAVYFIAGVVMDGIVTAYTYSVSVGNTITAALLSAAITIVGTFAVSGLLAGTGRRRVTLILAYALGNGIGTAAVMLIG